MSTRLFAIRPEPGLADTLATGAEVGLDIHGEPLFAVEPMAWKPVDADDIDALLVGSANAIRHGGPGLAVLAKRPVYAVGTKTADAAREAGFAVAATGEGGLQAVLDTVDAPVRLLRLAGEARVELSAPKGVEIVERTVYRSAPREMSPDFAKRLAGGGIVLVHSAVAGAHFAGECNRLGVRRDRLALVALGPRILAAAGAGWAWSAAAPEPTEPALLALARDMCLSGDGSKNGH